MFKKVINHPQFWRSVISIGLAFSVLFILFKWVLEGFKFDFVADPTTFFMGVFAGGFVYGFFVTYGKFWRKLKEKDK